jgi:chlorite dismutase
MMTSEVPRQFVKYTFYTVAPEWRRLPDDVRQEGKRQFASVVAEYAEHLTIRSYSLMGMRADAEMMLWCVSPDLEHIQRLNTHLAQTGLGTYLEIQHSYLAMTRRSLYIDDHEHQESESRTRIRPMNKPYLFVYPFVKTHEWYQLGMEERQRMMEEHFRVGHKYSQVKIHTAYSYGMDDQEFVLGFETDSPSEFLELVMELRPAEQRPYTERDVPIFTCLLQPVDEVLDNLGG